LVHYTIDHSREFRGYWVATEEANYWLQQPCKKRLALDSCTITVGMANKGVRGEFPRSQIELPSQQDLHGFHRAQLGLFSNLVDLMFPPIASANSTMPGGEDDDDSRDFYVHYFSKQTPQEIFEELSPSPGLMEFYQEKNKRHDPSEPLAPLYEHPFDLSLLSSPCSMEFLYPHIRHLHTIQLNESTFLKALKGNVKPIDDDDDDEYESQPPSYLLSTSSEETYWRQSAEEAERRSQQTPWGQPIPGSQQPPNLVNPLELGLEYRVSKLGAPDSSNGAAERQGSSSVVHSDTTLLSTTVLSNQQTSNVKNGQPAQSEGDDLGMQPTGILSNPSLKRHGVERCDSFLCDSGCESDVNERRQRPKTTHSHEKVASINVVSTDMSEGEEDESGSRYSSKNMKKAIQASISVEQQFPENTQPSFEPTVATPGAIATPVLEKIERVAKSQVTDEPHNILGSDEVERQMNRNKPPARVSETETLQPHQQDRKSSSSKYEERTTRSDFEKRDHNNSSDFRRPTFGANRSNNYEERHRQPSSNNSERSQRDSRHRQHFHPQREEIEYSAAAHGDPSGSNRRRESESGSYTRSLDYAKRNTPNPAHQPQNHVSDREERQPQRPSTHRDEHSSRNHSLEPPSSFQRHPSSFQRHQHNPGSARGFEIEPIRGDERRPRPPMSRHIRDYHENFEHPPRRQSGHIRDCHDNFEQPPRRRIIELPHRNEEGFRDRQPPTSSNQSIDRGSRYAMHLCDNRGDFEPRHFARESPFPQRDDSRGIAKKLDADMIRRVWVERHHQNMRRQSDHQTSPSPRDSRPGAFRSMGGGSQDPHGAHEQGHRSTRNTSDTRSHRPCDTW
jgi:hypothetical protein